MAPRVHRQAKYVKEEGEEEMLRPLKAVFKIYNDPTSGQMSAVKLNAIPSFAERPFYKNSSL